MDIRLDEQSDSELEPRQEQNMYDDEGELEGKVWLTYERNYCKNIFLAMIDHINCLGLQELLQNTINVKSYLEIGSGLPLRVFYRLTTQPWYKANVRSSVIIASVCSKIMGSARIKRKLFQLKMAETMLGHRFFNESYFRKGVAHYIDYLCNVQVPVDELFDFPSITHYLLYFMLRLLSQDFHVAIELPAKNGKTLKLVRIGNKVVQISAKDQIKYYTATICLVLRSKNVKKQQLHFFSQKLCDMLAKREKQIKQKYNLSTSIINCNLFMSEIVQKCISSKHYYGKVSKHQLDLWVRNFITLYLSINGRENIEQSDTESEIIEMMDLQSDFWQEDSTDFLKHSFDSKSFCPILLQVPIPSDIQERQMTVS